MASGDDGQEPAWTGPEDIWLEFIKDIYPRLHQQTYFYPPLQFNRTPHTVHTVAGQRVRVWENPGPQPRSRVRRPPPPPPPSQVAGRLYVPNSPHLQPVLMHDSALQGDQAESRCLQALSKVTGGQGGQVMMVISDFMFRKYMHDVNPLNQERIAQLPSIHSVPSRLDYQECDHLIIHRDRGIVVGEVKAVGDSQFFASLDPSQQDHRIFNIVYKAVQQLDMQETALRHLLHDLPGIRITKIVMLPNISSAQLRSALSTSSQLTEELVRCTQSVDVNQAIIRCLCGDFLAKPSTWWHSLWEDGPDPVMSPALYERLVARFCGPASSVHIPTIDFFERKVVRSQGEAVVQTGRQFSFLTLMPTHLELLGTTPEPPYVYVQGPPGTGKTLVLVMKAMEWAVRGGKVVIVSQPWRSAAVSILIKHHLVSELGEERATAIGFHVCNFDDEDLDVNAAIDSLKEQLTPCPTLIICDETDWEPVKFKRWVTKVHNRLPDVHVWMAGKLNKDNCALSYPLPEWLKVVTVREPVYCTPAVTRVVQGLTEELLSFDYKLPALPMPTEGLPVRHLKHKGQPNHAAGDHSYLKCDHCADEIFTELTELRVGQPGHPQYRDTWILCWGYPEKDVQMVERLRHHGLPVRVVEGPLLTDEDAEELALAVGDEIVVTNPSAVQGLHRSVVISLGRSLDSTSRCTAFLCCID